MPSLEERAAMAIQNEKRHRFFRSRWKKRARDFGIASRLFYATEYSCMQFSSPEGTIFASKGDKRCALPSKRKQKTFNRVRKGRRNGHYEQVSPGERFKNTIILFALRLEWIKHIAIWGWSRALLPIYSSLLLHEILIGTEKEIVENVTFGCLQMCTYC